MTKYDIIFESLQEQVESGELTVETAEYLNDVAYEMYGDVEADDEEYTEAMSNFAWQRKQQAQTENNKRVSRKSKGVMTTKMSGNDVGAFAGATDMVGSDDNAEKGAGKNMQKAIRKADETAAEYGATQTKKATGSKVLAKATKKSIQLGRQGARNAGAGISTGDYEKVQRSLADMSKANRDLTDQMNKANALSAKQIKDLEADLKKARKAQEDARKAQQAAQREADKRVADAQRKAADDLDEVEGRLRRSQSKHELATRHMAQTKGELAIANKNTARAKAQRNVAIGAAAIGGGILAAQGAGKIIKMAKSNAYKKEVRSKIKELEAAYKATKNPVTRAKYAEQIKELKVAIA